VEKRRTGGGDLSMQQRRSAGNPGGERTQESFTFGVVRTLREAI